MENNKGTSFAYKVKGIETRKIEINFDIGFDILNSLRDDNVKKKIDVKTLFTVEKSKNLLHFEITTYVSHKETDTKFIEHIGVTIFSILNLEIAFDETNNKFNLPNELVHQLFSISYTHCRALIAAELNKTIFKDILYLPIVDPRIITDPRYIDIL